MSIPVTTTFANPDPLAAPTTFGQAVAILRTLISSVIPINLTPYVLGVAPPDVEDQDKAWIRTDAAGSPIGTYIYKGGVWVREAPHPSGQFGYYIGNPTVDFDGTGLGLKGSGAVALQFYGWALMNGLNGTANMSDKFIIAARMDNVGISGYSSGVWHTNVRGTAEVIGGDTEITLTNDNTFRPATDAISAAHYSADGNTRDGSGGIWGKDAGDGTGSPFDLVPADAGNPTPDTIPIVPPFYALAMIQYLGPIY